MDISLDVVNVWHHVILCACLRCVWIIWCHTLTTSKLMFIRSLFVVLTKYWTAPWGWFLCEPKHIGATVIVLFSYFRIEVLYYCVCLLDSKRFFITVDARCKYEPWAKRFYFSWNYEKHIRSLCSIIYVLKVRQMICKYQLGFTQLGLNILEMWHTYWNERILCLVLPQIMFESTADYGSFKIQANKSVTR
jgi:hypothetical protein